MRGVTPALADPSSRISATPLHLWTAGRAALEVGIDDRQLTAGLHVDLGDFGEANSALQEDVNARGGQSASAISSRSK